jgi:hypothetical protein
MVVPGYLADDNSTRALRWFLRDRGYFVHAWRLGRNTVPTDAVVDASSPACARCTSVTAGA